MFEKHIVLNFDGLYSLSISEIMKIVPNTLSFKCFNFFVNADKS